MVVGINPSYLEEDDEILVDTDGDLLLLGVGAFDFFPVILVGGGGLVGALDVELPNLVLEAGQGDTTTAAASGRGRGGNFSI